MEAGLDEGFAFTSSDIWRSSLFSNNIEPQKSIFPDLDIDLLPLKLDNDPDGSKNLIFDLDIPELRTENSNVLEDVEPFDESDASAPSECCPPGNERTPEHDLWDLDLEIDSVANNGQLYTWEALEKKPQDASHPKHLSEAGDGVFDAAVQKYRIDHRTNDAEGVLTINVLIRSLIFLGLGKESIYFQWNAKQRSFIQTLGHVPISGHSLTTSASFMRDVVQAGTLARRLAEYAESAQSSCPAQAALQRAVATILSTIEEDITSRQGCVRSLLQLQNVLDRPRQITNQLQVLINLTEGAYTDAELASHAAAFALQQQQQASPFVPLFQNIVSLICVPWLASTERSLGLSPESFTEVFGTTFEIDSSDFDVSVDSRPRRTTSMPSFVSSEEANLIEETTKSLAMLRSNVPHHPLVQPAAWAITCPRLIRESSGPDFDQILADAKRYEAEVAVAIASYESGGSCQTFGRASSRHGEPRIEAGSLAWSKNERIQHGFLEDLGSVFEQEPSFGIGDLPDELQILAAQALQNTSETKSERVPNLFASPSEPMHRLRPLLHIQSRLVNAALLRHLFKQVELREHLNLQHSYHLFGNGDFLIRMSAALFDSDMQTAERKRGVMPSSGAMGLRLDSRTGQKWPPASSELRLTLTGLLVETYTRRNAHRSAPKDLPGGLSFSIRELTDAEIDRVTNANSTYALDFLRLQYSPPKPLDVLLTPTTMQQYDDIFRFLLKIVRLEHVATQLFMMTRGSDIMTRTSPKARRVTAEIRHVMSVLMSHFMDVGIGAPWRHLSHALDDVESGMRWEDEVGELGSRVTLGFDGLKSLHSSFLERVRSRLFLRRKQSTLRAAVDALFDSILEVAVLLQTHDAADEADVIGVLEAAVLHLFDHLRAETTIVPKPVAADEDDHEAMKILMFRLDMNGYYSTRNDARVP